MRLYRGRLAGLVLIDDRRAANEGGPRLRKLQEDLLQKTDRRRAAIASDPRFMEVHNFNGHLDGLAARSEREFEPPFVAQAPVFPASHREKDETYRSVLSTISFVSFAAALSHQASKG